MGYAIKIPNVNYTNGTLGKVTPKIAIAVEGLSIIGDDTVDNDNNQATYSVAFSPLDSTQREIQWSIIDGSDYASIDANTGVLTVKSGANTSNVTIKASSTSNSNISAMKTISVTYRIVAEDLEYIAVDEDTAYLNTGILPAKGYNYTIQCMTPDDVPMTQDADIFGCREGYEKNSIYVEYCKTIILRYSTGVITMENGYAVNSIYTSELFTDHTNLYKDGLLISTKENSDYSYASTYPIYLFALNNGGALRASTYKRCIYKFKVETSETDVANFKPVLLNGVPKFYDTVNETYYDVSGATHIYYKKASSDEQTYTV